MGEGEEGPGLERRAGASASSLDSVSGATPAGASTSSIETLEHVAGDEGGAAVEGEAQEEGFTDFTIATNWERRVLELAEGRCNERAGCHAFVASIERCLGHWVQKEVARARERSPGQPLLRLAAQLSHRLPFRQEPYTLSLHLPPGADLAPERGRGRGAGSSSGAGSCSGAAAAWRGAAGLCDRPDKRQEWFGLGGPFLVLAPNSYSGRLLEEGEAATLLSAGAAALGHLRLPAPLLLPVADALRDGCQGAALAGGAVLRYASDSVHTASYPAGLLSLEGQLAALAQRLAPHAPRAAAAARAALAGGGGLEPGRLAVAASMRSSFEVPYAGDLDEGSREEVEIVISDWDADAAWRPWAAQADPIACLELDVLWSYPAAAAAARAEAGAAGAGLAGEGGGGDGDGGGGGADPTTAAEWRLSALGAGHERDTGQRGFLLRAGDKRRRFLRLRSVLGAGAEAAMAEAAAAEAAPAEDSFCGMLGSLAESCKWVARARAMADLASGDWWLQQGAYLPLAPAAWVLSDAISDILDRPSLPVWPASASAGTSYLRAGGGGRRSRGLGAGGAVGKAAPLGALLSRFALHALVLNNPRAIALLWSRLVDELRLAHWEPLTPLPRMPGAGSGSSSGGGGDHGGPCGPVPGAACGGPGQPPPAIDLHSSLLHQKLQLLDLCIQLRRQQQQQEEEEEEEGATPRQGQRRLRSCAGSAGEAAGAEPGGGGSSGHGTPTGSQSGYQSAQEEGSEEEEAYYSYYSPEKDIPTSLASPPHASTAGPRFGGPPHAADSGGAAAAAAAAREEEDAAAEPRGVTGLLEGATLLRHPGRPIRIPVTQGAVPATDDMLRERLGPGAGLQGSLEGRVLRSEMQAFKAANPGACLADFVRWRSPRDWARRDDGGGGLSERMRAPGGAWQALWDGASPAAAAAQRPLFSPVAEGERALHYLETLPPPLLWDELLCLGLSAAVGVLGAAADGARLPAAAAELRAAAAVAEPLLAGGTCACSQLVEREGVPGGPGLWLDGSGEEAAALGAGSSGDDGDDGGGSHGWRSGAACTGKLGGRRYQELLRVLGCAEQAVVAGTSLLLRLSPPETGRAASAERADGAGAAGASDSSSSGSSTAGSTSEWPECSGGGEPAPSQFALQAAGALLAAALGLPPDQGEQQQWQQGGEPIAQQPGGRGPACHGDGVYAVTVAVAEADRPAVAALMRRRAGGEGAAGSGGGGGGRWPEPFQREWLVEVGQAAAGAGPAQRAESADLRQPALPPSRLYVRVLPAELRLATVVVSE
eukprot:scaffold5.g967.t1